MNRSKAKINETKVSVIGGGIAGITTAFYLGKKGYQVNLIDRKVNLEINNVSPNNGSEAALGVLMGNIYKRSKGRGWLLRNKSIKLWKEWLNEIDSSESKIKLEKPLIKLARSEIEYQSMIEISKNKKEYEIELLNKNSLEYWSEIFEKKLIGGFISHRDGRLNPIQLINQLMKQLDKLKVTKISDNAIRINKNNNSCNQRWSIQLESNQSINQDYIVICSALNTQKLLNPLGHQVLLEPILGQAFEIDLANKVINWKKWPAILNFQSINFIPHHPNRLIIGATIEKSSEPNLLYKEEMLKMNNTAPEWLKNSKIKHEWNGIRARPTNEPSPLLKELEPGLIINTGHYRNGILLAPACAEWIGCKIDEKKY